MNNLINQIDWKKQSGLVPAIIQNAITKQVLMLGYLNQESLQKTLETQKVWFFSRSKNRLWMKGEESGNELNVIDIKVDCDQDTLLITVQPKGPTCHTGKTSCFGENSEGDLCAELFQVILDRKQNLPKNSYTTSLFQQGLSQICAKVEEESGEVIRAATSETQQRVIEEGVDVIYHLFVLLVQQEISWKALLQEIKKRRG